MKFHITEDRELLTTVRQALKENDGYCPCVFESKGKEKYRCMCEHFRIYTKPGEACHCGIYIKDQE